MRMRPIAPPLLFWNVSASTTCSRVTLPILVSTRPIGRPWSWSIGGMLADEPPPLEGLATPPTGTGFAPLAGTTTFDAGRSPLPGLIGATGFLFGSGAAGLGVV